MPPARDDLALPLSINAIRQRVSISRDELVLTALAVYRVGECRAVPTSQSCFIDASVSIALEIAR